MGLYSTVYNQCQELGPEFIGELQTKDLESIMDSYWLSPDGRLYRIDDDGTWDLERDEEAGNRFFPFRRVPTGKHGKVRPYRKSGVLCLTTHHDGEYMECLVHFKTGMLTGVLCRGPMFSCRSVDD